MGYLKELGLSSVKKMGQSLRLSPTLALALFFGGVGFAVRKIESPVGGGVGLSLIKTARQLSEMELSLLKTQNIVLS